MAVEDIATPNQGVDRGRRYWFISRLTAFCLVSALILTTAAGAGILMATPMVELYVTAVMSLATATVVAYVGGSVIDYNGGPRHMFTRGTPAVSTDPAHVVVVPDEPAKG